MNGGCSLPSNPQCAGVAYLREISRRLPMRADQRLKLIMTGKETGSEGSGRCRSRRNLNARFADPDNAMVQGGLWGYCQASCWSMKAVSWALLMAPTLVAAS